MFSNGNEKTVFTYIVSGVLLPPFQAPYECDYLAHFLSEKLAGKFICSISFVVVYSTSKIVSYYLGY